MFGEDFFTECINGANEHIDVTDGVHRLKVTKVEEKDTMTGGVRLQCTFVVTSGDCEGGVIQTSFNIVNKSEKAQHIGRAQLGKLFIACGIETPKSFNQLIGKSIIGKVEHQENQGRSYPRVVAFAPIPKETPEEETGFAF